MSETVDGFQVLMLVNPQNQPIISFLLPSVYGVLPMWVEHEFPDVLFRMSPCSGLI